jgi:membrane protease YdiL (CAAX protease family)
MYFDAWLALIPSACIALTLFSGDLTRRDIFLAIGKLNARVVGPGRIRWSIVAPAVLLFMIFGLREQLRFILGDVHVARHAGSAAITALSLSFAVINAANEEFRFRLVLVARGKRALGQRAVLWMTSINFGLAHWDGRPGGPTGVLATTLFAMLLCQSLYDTEGGLWAWLMHAAGDVIIFGCGLASCWIEKSTPHLFGHTTHCSGISSHRHRLGMSPLPRSRAEQAIKHQVSRYISNIP